MALPGTVIEIVDSAPPRTLPTDTGQAFVAQLTDRGPLIPILVSGMTDFVRKLGDRVAYSPLYDWADLFFHEGGSRLWVSRVIGPSKVSAFRVLNDSLAAATLRVTAVNPGEWGNDLHIAVDTNAQDATIPVGSFRFRIGDGAGNLLAQSPVFVNKDALFDSTWATANGYVVFTDQASVNDPAALVSTALASGTDDRANITDADYRTALDRFTPDLGPGQVAMPGRTTDQAHIDLLAHAAARHRVALLDPPDDDDTSVLIASAVAARGNGRWGGMFAPWIVIPGLAAATTRVAPPSALLAGIIASNDAQTDADVAAAGDRGVSFYSLDLSQPAWTDAQREALADAGVNVIRRYLGIRIYDFQSLADPAIDSGWAQLTSARITMAIAAQGGAIAERYIFGKLSRLNIARYGRELSGMLNTFYEAESLFGDNPAEAFAVNTGDDVNTVTTIAAGQLIAVLSYRPTPYARELTLRLVKKLTTEVV